MIKRLQIKFVCIMMGVLFLVFTVLVATLNIFVYMSNAEQTDNIGVFASSRPDGRGRASGAFNPSAL